MMDYQLAQRLENAGLVSKATFKAYAKYLCPHQLDGTAYIGHIEDCAERIYPLTLEELIEECRISRGFFRLEEVSSFDGTWKAKMHGTDKGWFTGNTPTEAVARLWLALNKPMVL